MEKWNIIRLFVTLPCGLSKIWGSTWKASHRISFTIIFATYFKAHLHKCLSITCYLSRQVHAHLVCQELPPPDKASSNSRGKVRETVIYGRDPDRSPPHWEQKPLQKCMLGREDLTASDQSTSPCQQGTVHSGKQSRQRDMIWKSTEMVKGKNRNQRLPELNATVRKVKG